MLSRVRPPKSSVRGAFGDRGIFQTNEWKKDIVTLSPAPYGSLVDTIEPSLLFTEEVEPKISDTKYVASYNWVNSRTPSILVPGRSFYPRSRKK